MDQLSCYMIKNYALKFKNVRIKGKKLKYKICLNVWGVTKLEYLS
jgi:hypothetical protein